VTNIFPRVSVKVLVASIVPKGDTFIISIAKFTCLFEVETSNRTLLVSIPILDVFTLLHRSYLLMSVFIT
jgi:hypothetical protein